jgi:hypothetical protein
MKQIITYKFWDSKKRRLAILAQEIDLEHTEITIITCSRKDPFTKYKVRKALLDSAKGIQSFIDKDLVHPEKIIIAHHGDFARSFFDWANRTYFKMYERTTYRQSLQLERGNERIHIKDIAGGKLDKRW